VPLRLLRILDPNPDCTALPPLGIPPLIALLPPSPPLGVKPLKPSFDLEVGMSWELARSESSLENPLFEKENSGLLFDAENQSSIGDVCDPSVSRSLSSEYPLDFGVKAERDASEPSTVGSLYLMAAADDRQVSGNISDKSDDCCAVPNGCESGLLLDKGERDASEPIIVGPLYLVNAADDR